MAKLTRVFQKRFAKNAGSQELGKFGSLANGTPEYTTNPATMQSLANYDIGWFAAIIGRQSPPIQDMNTLFYIVTYQLAYLFQMGIAEWDAQTEYHKNSMVLGSDGKVYKSIEDNNMNNNTSDASFWVLQPWESISKILTTDEENIPETHLDILTDKGAVVEYNALRIGTGSSIPRAENSRLVRLSQSGMTIGANSNLGKLAYSASLNRYVCITATSNPDEPKLFYSDDGSNWFAVGLGNNRPPNDVKFENGIFVVVFGNGTVSGTPKIATSADGITWTLRTTPWDSTAQTPVAVAYGNSKFLVQSSFGGTNQILQSVDNGVTWTEIANTAQDFNDIGFFAGLFVRKNPFGSVVQSSPDGVTWTARSMIVSSYGFIFTTLTHIYIVGTTDMARSTDCINWTTVNFGAGALSNAVGAAHNGSGKIIMVNGFAFVGPNNSPRYSQSTDNGATWSLVSYDDNIKTKMENQNGICYGNGQFVVSCNNTKYPDSRIALISDNTLTIKKMAGKFNIVKVANANSSQSFKVTGHTYGGNDSFLDFSISNSGNLIIKKLWSDPAYADTFNFTFKKY